MSSIVIESGVLARIGAHVPRAHAYAVITDSNVAGLYGRRVAGSLGNAELFEFAAGEANKSRETWMTLTDALLERGYGRDCCIVAVGGGVTCDLAGFVAATYLRGVPIVQVPTSLLAMIDAALGGKTGVDVAAGKNLVGAFHQPHCVVIDAGVLATLPAAELSNGLAEAIKHGAIADEEYLAWITDHADGVFERRTDMLEHLVQRSIAIKTQFVRDDEREAAQRAALNFGHTIGHALERLSGYAIQHGHAVALGMMMEAEIGTALGVTAAGTVQHIHRAVRAARLPHRIVFDDTGPTIAATRSDKKARGGAVRYVLLEKPGRVARSERGEWTWQVADDVVREALKQFSV
jgi:3-dehydroquinate synthase